MIGLDLRESPRRSQLPDWLTPGLDRDGDRLSQSEADRLLKTLPEVLSVNVSGLVSYVVSVGSDQAVREWFSQLLSQSRGQPGDCRKELTYVAIRCPEALPKLSERDREMFLSHSSVPVRMAVASNPGLCREVRLRAVFESCSSDPSQVRAHRKLVNETLVSLAPFTEQELRYAAVKDPNVGVLVELLSRVLPGYRSEGLISEVLRTLSESHPQRSRSLVTELLLERSEPWAVWADLWAESGGSELWEVVEGNPAHDRVWNQVRADLATKWLRETLSVSGGAPSPDTERFFLQNMAADPAGVRSFAETVAVELYRKPKSPEGRLLAAEERMLAAADSYLPGFRNAFNDSLLELATEKALTGFGALTLAQVHVKPLVSVFGLPFSSLARSLPALLVIHTFPEETATWLCRNYPSMTTAGMEALFAVAEDGWRRAQAGVTLQTACSTVV